MPNVYMPSLDKQNILFIKLHMTSKTESVYNFKYTRIRQTDAKKFRT